MVYDKYLYSQSYGFSSSHVWIRELRHEEGWASKNWCFWSVVLEKTLERPLNSKEIKPVNAKGNHPWIFTGGTDAKAKAARFCPSAEKSQVSGKDPDAGKGWEQGERWWQGMRGLDGITNSMGMNLGKLWRQWRTGKPGMLQFMRSQRIGHDFATEKQWPNPRVPFLQL